ncbi:MAG TPA: (deoxy)nucleoside triphosphate pyrophosphohydrolase [Candidatus Angelobacter sp.]|jgi:8-oxo-dGTP diphosphatase|nr:(deoxy)nucleoside triphosphate pyrophosphohydrolase [Candidatus Angelobacter sp.]
MKQVVAGLVVRGDEILICQRTKYQPLPLKWEFPGGKIEPHEQPTEALYRELEEELGILAEIGPKVATICHDYGNGAAVELHFYRIERFQGEIENRIFRDVRWVRRAELPAYDFLEADVALVRDIASGRMILSN